ncbi:hypothetical protein VTJ04DRAFT_5096 [Mycothermus thermophilus]|uniref:uncharacterized protein n=1 Tax=Humicola insolens TaxID=85995 RepID=UPI003742D977
MQLSLSTVGLFLLGLAGISSAAPAPQDARITRITPTITLEPVQPTDGLIPGLPPHCYKELPLPLAPRSCYTHTTTTTVTPIQCPAIRCPPIYCPAIVSITSVPVPCHDECCPRTPTKTVTVKAPCPTCPSGCSIPVYTETYTTGCSRATIGPIITATLPTRSFRPTLWETLPAPTVGPVPNPTA